MEELKTLINKRGYINKTNCFAQMWKNTKVTSDDLNKLKTRLDVNQHLLEKYNEIHEQILIYSSDEQHETEIELFENNFWDVKADIESFIEKNQKVDNKNKTVFHENSPNVEESPILLPNIKIPSFNGEFENWLEFRDTFDLLFIKIHRYQIYKNSFT